MLNRKTWEWLGLADWAAAAALIGSILFVGLLLGVLPRWLRGRERADYQGMAAQTSPGIVSMVTISPVSQGGGGLFNAVAITFDNNRRTAYYALPKTSQWLPKYHDPVMVTYRIGRHSGIVHVDAVTPDTP